MCGIVGYCGTREAVPILIEGLHRLEYRGYDSAGVAVQNGTGVVLRKLAGRVVRLHQLLDAEPVRGQSGIAHTRWATHGAPTRTNAHPHTDCTGTIALVHNGIIENADALRTKLQAAGHEFGTETDTETLAHLIEEAPGATLEDRVIAALAHVEGTYGLAVISSAEPGKIVVARQGSPVLLGIGDKEYFVASDASRHPRAHPLGRLSGRRRHRGRDSAGVPHRGSRAAGPGAAGERHRVGPRRHRAGRLPPLHAEGDLRAARDRDRDAARPPAVREGQRPAQRVEPDAGGLRRHPAHPDRRVRHVVALGTGGSLRARRAGPASRWTWSTRRNTATARGCTSPARWRSRSPSRAKRPTRSRRCARRARRGAGSWAS